MSEPSTRWGLYQWYEEHGAELIHPDDLETVRKLVPGNRVFRVAGEKAGFLYFRYGEIEFRGRPRLLERIKAQVREVGDTVTLTDGRSAQVMDVRWHFQRAEPMYQLRVEGKKRSKRYWNSDLK